MKPETPAKPKTSKNHPTKITLIIQLMGLLNTLLPNHELFRFVVKLVKVFISMAFTLSRPFLLPLLGQDLSE